MLEGAAVQGGAVLTCGVQGMDQGQRLQAVHLADPAVPMPAMRTATSTPSQG